MSEQWRAIPGYEGLYEVSDLGHVRSLTRTVIKAGTAHRIQGRVLRPSSSTIGYQHVSLSREGKKFTQLVHRAVLAVFVGPCPEGLEARHIDGDPTNNTRSNLEWGTHSENNRDRVRHGTHHLAKRTHCNRGHPFDDAYRTAEGARVCRVCRREWQRARQARKKAENA